LLLTAADATASALSTKRDEAQSYTITQVDALIAGSRPISAVDGLQAELDAKASLTQLSTEITTLGDSVTSRLTGKLDKSAAYTSTEVDQLLLTAADSTASALSTKRDEAQSYTITQVDNLIAGSRPISGVEGLQASLDTKASLTQLSTEITTLGDSVTTRLTGKRDKSGSYSSTQVDQLLSDAADSTNASLSTKRDESESYSSTQIDGLVSSVRAESYTSVEVDALLDTKHPTIGNNGSLDIAVIGGLNAVLSSFQPLITSGNLSIAMTSGLQIALNTLATDVAAIPTSQVILSNGTFVDQHRFGIDNGEVVLDLNLGWLFRATPLWSQLRNDPIRVRHAKAGHLPMDPASDSYCYFPRISGDEDISPAALNWVVPTSANQTSEYGNFKLAEITPAMLGFYDGPRIFANTSTPSTQPSAKGIGWGSTSSDAWCIELQVKLLDSNSVFSMMWSPDPDRDLSGPDFLTKVQLHATGGFDYRWEDRQGASAFDSVSGVVSVNTWHHVAIQKPSGGDRLYFYLDGILRFESDVTANPPQTIDLLWVYGTGNALWREFSVRASCPFPTIPFSPNSPVSFASLLGLGQSRWNSYMLG